MQMTLNINEQLFQEAVKLLSNTDKNKVIELALQELAKNHQIPTETNILYLYGKLLIIWSKL